MYQLETYNALSVPYVLATRLTGDYRDRTYTGKCGQASLDIQHAKKAPTSSFSTKRKCLKGFIEPAAPCLTHFDTGHRGHPIYLFESIQTH
jgi:hypothetical protein